MLIESRENVQSISANAKIAIAKKTDLDALRKRLILPGGIVTAIPDSRNSKGMSKFDIYVSGKDEHFPGVNSHLSQAELDIITPLVTLVELDVSNELNLFTYGGIGAGAYHCKTLKDAARRIIDQRKGIIQKRLHSGSILVISPTTGENLIKVSNVVFLEANILELTKTLEESIR